MEYRLTPPENEARPKVFYGHGDKDFVELRLRAEVGTREYIALLEQGDTDQFVSSLLRNDKERTKWEKVDINLEHSPEFMSHIREYYRGEFPTDPQN